tara:strand:+ start:220 stop:738 length:519 start_codon:yes stop_codon:yes gene_type:complete
MLDNIYKEIKNYQDYKINRHGIVKSYRLSDEGAILKPSVRPSGLTQYTLIDDEGWQVSVNMVKLIAIAWMGYDENSGMQIEMLDRNHISTLTLRLVKDTELSTNRNSSSKYKGISYLPKRDKWKVRLKRSGSNGYIGLGEYKTEAIALEALRMAKNNIKEFRSIKEGLKELK